jgi:hypothetical protein
VQDPPSTIGSGGATVNALMVATEYLSARNGHTVISADTLRDTSILVLHLVSDLSRFVLPSTIFPTLLSGSRRAVMFVPFVPSWHCVSILGRHLFVRSVWKASGKFCSP